MHCLFIHSVLKRFSVAGHFTDFFLFTLCLVLNRSPYEAQKYVNPHPMFSPFSVCILSACLWRFLVSVNTTVLKQKCLYNRRCCLFKWQWCVFTQFGKHGTPQNNRQCLYIGLTVKRVIAVNCIVAVKIIYRKKRDSNLRPSC